MATRLSDQRVAHLISRYCIPCPQVAIITTDVQNTESLQKKLEIDISSMERIVFTDGFDTLVIILKDNANSIDLIHGNQTSIL